MVFFWLGVKLKINTTFLTQKTGSFKLKLPGGGILKAFLLLFRMDSAEDEPELVFRTTRAAVLFAEYVSHFSG